MRLALLTIGSRGDVQPFLALGRALQRIGHEPRVLTHPRFEPLVTAAGLPFAPVAEGEISVGPQTEAGRRWMESGSRHLPTWVGYLRDGRSVVRERLRDALAAGADADAFVASDLATLVGWQLALRFDRPLVRVSLNLPSPLARRRGPVAALGRAAAWRVARAWLGRARRDVGLPPIPAVNPLRALDAGRALHLRAYTAAMAPAPDPRRDWVHVTGYWFLEDGLLDAERPAELEPFLAAGEPPVCLDFGSMLEADPEGMTEMALEALARVGRRGVLIRGRYRQADVAVPRDVLAIDAVSHGRLFGRCAAVVHHAGAGTAAAVLRAGVPSVTVPHTTDQLRFSRRLAELGVAGTPIRRRDLTVERLEAEIRAATEDPGRRDAAVALGEIVRGEDGAARAATILDHHLRPVVVPVRGLTPASAPAPSPVVERPVPVLHAESREV